MEKILKKLSDFYKKYYKTLIIFPVILFLFSLIIISNTISKDGSPIYRDVSLKGGLSSVFEVSTDITSSQLRDELISKYGDYSFTVSDLVDKGVKTGFIIDTDLDEENLLSFMNNKFGVDFEFGKNYSSNFISPTLSSSFFKQAMVILAISFALMATVVFIYFRVFVPSFAVVLSGLFDIVVTVGILDLLGIKISIAGIGALLMLIGYSIDTDVLLTNRVFKERGDDYFEKAFFAFKTGTLMSLTTLIAGVAALVLTNSDVIFEIAVILVVGLLVDYVSTWIQNTGILLWWLTSKK